MSLPGVEKTKKAHRAILDVLVANRALDAPVAEQIQLAFTEAVSYVSGPAPSACYEVTQLGLAYARSRSNLMQQRQVLLQMAEADSIDPDVVARAEAAISRDLSFFRAAEEHEQEMAGLTVKEELAKRAESGEIGVTDEAKLAAHILANLLLGKE